MAKAIFKYFTLALSMFFCSCQPAERRIINNQIAQDNPSHDGEFLFKRHCFSCHKMKEKDESMFAQIFNRLPEPGESYFVNYIKDSKALKTSGDEYALKVDSEYPSGYEHSFSNLTKEEIQALINYIKSKSN